MSDDNKKPDQPAPRPEALDNLEILDREMVREVEVVAEQVSDAEASDISKRQKEKKLDEAARMGAAMGYGITMALIGAKWPQVPPHVDADMAAQIIDAATPVARKWNGDGEVMLPEWLLPYKEELKLLGVIGASAFTVYMRMAAAKAQEEADRKKQGDNAQPNPPSQPASRPAPVVQIRRDSLDPNAPPVPA